MAERETLRPALFPWLLRRLGLAGAGAAAVMALLAYFLVIHYQSIHSLREKVVAQRRQEAMLHAVSLGTLLSSAAEAVRNASESSEVDAFFANRDLGMSMEYGLRLSLVPITERFRAAVEARAPSGTPVLARLVLLDEAGAVLAQSGPPDVDAGAGPLGHEAPAEGMTLAREGRELVISRGRWFKGRFAGWVVGWVASESLSSSVGPAGTGWMWMLDDEGTHYRPDAWPASPLDAVPGLERVPSDGSVTELSDPGGTLIAMRLPVEGHRVSLLVVDRADALLGSLSPHKSVLALLTAAVAVLLGAALAFFFSARSMVLRARLEESVRRKRELEVQHRALQQEVEARHRLEASHARLAQAVGQAAEGIALTDPQGVLEYVNPAFERMTGWALSELRSAAEIDRSEPEDPPTLAAAFASSSGWVGEVPLRRRDGAVLVVEAMLSPSRGPAGDTVSRVLVLRDVTEEQRLRERLRHAQKLEAVGTLAGGVAHDFNNLLSVINGYAAMALAGMAEDHPVREDLREILAAGGRAAKLTRQLLAFGRRQVLKPEVLDLNEAVSGVEKMLRRLIPENIQLVTEPAPSLHQVRVDPGQLEQVLVNLVVNARDASAGGGRIVVSTSDVFLRQGDDRLDHDAAPGWYACVAVRDQGVGMDDATRARCFEPFFTTKPPGQGTGLGLSTVYGIVRQSRGFVRVVSRPNEGATFELYFPGTDQRPPAEHAGPAPLQEGPARPGETVLVVEDEAQLRELLRSRLAAQGYVTLSAADGEEALELAAGYPDRIDVLLSDVVMPKLSGPELARRFRTRFPQAVVLFMSGYSEEAVAQQGALAEGVAVIEKPAGLESVPAVIRSLLDARSGGPGQVAM
jgi:PAS domain S-box-containing protein